MTKRHLDLLRNFFTKETQYLRFVVDCQKIREDPEEVHVTYEMPVSHNVTTLRSLMGRLNDYYKCMWGMYDACLTHHIRSTSSGAVFLSSVNSFSANSWLEVFVAVDASKGSIGTLLRLPIA